MMMFVCFLAFSNELIDSVDRLGLYRPELATVWEWEDHYLFFEYSPAGIVKVSPEGKLRARFNQEGNGPKEIMRPVSLGFDREHLYVLSHGHKILVFDKNLTPTKKKMPSLRPILERNIAWQGIKLKDGTFVLLYGSTGLHHSHGLIRVKLDKDRWQVIERYFPFDIPSNNLNMPMPNVKNPKWQLGEKMLFRLTQAVLKSETSYEILMYSKPWESQEYEVPIGGMVAQVESIVSKNKHFKCFPSHIGMLKQGYVVELIFNQSDIAHDYFDSNGIFLRRDFDDYHIIPVINTNKTFKLTTKGETERLFLIQ